MSFRIDLNDVNVTFGDVRAVDDATLTIEAGRIVGLLGRNGAGKTTLMSVMAAHRRASSGIVQVDGQDPFEDPRLMSEICLVSDTGLEGNVSVRDQLGMTGALRPRWDKQFALRLLDRFEIPCRRRTSHLSRGQRSALAVAIGLATRAPLTMFDEPQIGMDAPNRYAFYDELLADYMAHPRTIVLSTHLIDEVASLFEDVVIIDRGRIVVHDSAEALRGRGVTVTGPAATVDRMIGGRSVLAERSLGSTKSVVTMDPIDERTLDDARSAGVEVGPVPLQDLFVHLTTRELTA